MVEPSSEQFPSASNDAQTVPDQAKNPRPKGDGRVTNRSRPLLRITVVVIAVVLLLFLGWWPKHQKAVKTEARAKAEMQSLPVVEVMTAQQIPETQQLTLPGTVTPVIEAHVFSRAAGYVEARYVDIGDNVREGQVLAVISAPDLDADVSQQQALLRSARDALNKAQAMLDLQQLNYQRTHTLVQHGILPQQEDDNARTAVESAAADVHSAENNIKAAEGTVARALTFVDYEKVRAPISGTITARNVEVGSLISSQGAGQGLMTTPNAAVTGGPFTGGAQGGELFRVADFRHLQVYVTVPEQNALMMQTGQDAQVSFSELPQEKFQGTVTRSSQSLNQENRSVLLQVAVSDPHHHLRPGMYALVEFQLKTLQPGILVSGDSIVATAQGEFVPVLRNNIIHMQQVQVGRDLGTQVYITQGLQNGDVVVVNPTDQVKEGVHVRTRPAPMGQQNQAGSDSPGHGNQLNKKGGGNL
jgi:multidrug efflux pump subunit AcrA (membrane-fusion protein)